ncbi:hypothetical protein chiPu_0031029 [Chiloscyllium punctatum]|uniref:Uncharacterized protein n=1 Tax=Chiloscyllium punctatum TaxID=137246 RepID=A0A401TVA1_CHIPU|nr:hypothetical protein [Chiloscyllium punctatum]
MRIAAIAGRVVFDQVTREHHLGIRHPGDDVARGVTGAELHQPHLALAEIDRHLALEGQRRPGQAGNACRILEQAREAAVFRIPILLAAFLDQPIGLLRGHDALRVIGRGAEYPHRVVMRQHDIFDRLVGDGLDPLDHLVGHRGRRLRVEHQAAVLADDHGGVGVALGGESVEIGADLGECDLLLGEIRGRCETFGHQFNPVFMRSLSPFLRGEGWGEGLSPRKR